jgi:SEL1 protein
MDVLSHYMQTPGPLGSALRIVTKLRGQVNRVVSAPPFSYLLSTSSGDSIVSKRDEERALMVIDLLQHAADLGNMDAQLLLSRIYMVLPILHVIRYPTVVDDAASSPQLQPSP